MIAWLQKRRVAPVWVMVAFFIAHFLFNTFFNTNMSINNAFASVYEATGGLINGTLLPNLIMLVALIGGIVLGLGRLRFADIGVYRSMLGRSLALLVLTWILLNVVLLVIGVLSGAEIRVDSRWNQVGVLAVIGGLIGQLFGNALLEELGYRGFLFPQLYHRLTVAKNPRVRVAMALFLSLVLFAAIHIPARLAAGMSIGSLMGSLAWLMLFGMFFAWFFLRTQSIWWAVIVHALANTPTPLIRAGDAVDASMILTLICLGLLILSFVWQPFRRFIDGLRPLQAE